eukprot:GEMP01003766.1.p1 GENE.GEMP01003766.1~~GEMP01003766.1.p1  ORF type:complete len:1129 (+),score=254.41 GEMP01003766.1:27-3413(+)
MAGSDKRTPLVFTVGEFRSYSIRGDGDVTIEPSLPTGLAFADKELKGTPIHPMPRTKFQFSLSHSLQTDFYIEIAGPTVSKFNMGSGALALSTVVYGMAVLHQWLYVAVDNQIRRIHAKSGTVELVIGARQGKAGRSKDGLSGRESLLNKPMGLALREAPPTLFICDSANHRVCGYDIDKDKLSTIWRMERDATSGDLESGSTPNRCCYRKNYLFVTTHGSPIVRMIDIALGTVSTYIDGGPIRKQIRFHPGGMCADGQYLYVVDIRNDRVLGISHESKKVEVVAGGGKKTNDGCDARDLQLESPHDVAIVPGLLLIATMADQHMWAVDLETRKCFRFVNRSEVKAGGAGRRSGIGGEDRCGESSKSAGRQSTEITMRAPALLCYFKAVDALLVNDYQHPRLLSVPIASPKTASSDMWINARKRKSRPSDLDGLEVLPKKRLSGDAREVNLCVDLSVRGTRPSSAGKEPVHGFVSDSSADSKARKDMSQSNARTSGRNSLKKERSSRSILDESTHDLNLLSSSVGLSPSHQDSAVHAERQSQQTRQARQAQQAHEGHRQEGANAVQFDPAVRALKNALQHVMRDLEKPIMPKVSLAGPHQFDFHSIPAPDVTSLQKVHLKGFEWARRFDPPAKFPVEGAFIHEDDHAQAVLKLASWMMPDADKLQRRFVKSRTEEEWSTVIRTLSKKAGDSSRFNPNEVMERQDKTFNMLKWYQQTVMEMHAARVAYRENNGEAMNAATKLYQQSRAESVENVATFGRYGNKCEKTLVKLDRTVAVIMDDFNYEKKRLDQQDDASVKRIEEIAEQIKQLSQEAVGQMRCVVHNKQKIRESASYVHELQEAAKETRAFLVDANEKYDALLDRWSTGIKQLDDFHQWFLACSDEAQDETNVLTAKIEQNVRRHNALYHVLEEDVRWLHNRYVDYSRQTAESRRNLEEEGNRLRCADFHREADSIQRKASELQKQCAVMSSKMEAIRKSLQRMKDESDVFLTFVQKICPNSKKLGFRDKDRKYVISFFPSRLPATAKTLADDLSKFPLEECGYANTPHPPRSGKRVQPGQKTLNSPHLHSKAMRQSWSAGKNSCSSMKKNASQHDGEKNSMSPRNKRAKGKYGSGRVPFRVLDFENTPNLL